MPILGNSEQTLHMTTNPVFDILANAASTTLQGNLGSLQLGVMLGHKTKPEQLVPSCWHGVKQKLCHLTVVVAPGVLQVVQLCFIQSHCVLCFLYKIWSSLLRHLILNAWILLSYEQAKSTFNIHKAGFRTCTDCTL